MKLTSIPGILLISAISLSAFAGDDEFKLMRNEAIGALKIGLPRAQAVQVVGSPPKAGRIEEWGADGQFHQKLTFKNAGIKLGVVSETKTSSQTVESITAVAPCSLTTKSGVHIGSSEAEVIKAYKREHNKEESVPGSLVVAGSIYGGIGFQLKNGKVSQIFLGAAAE